MESGGGSGHRGSAGTQPSADDEHKQVRILAHGPDGNLLGKVLLEVPASTRVREVKALVTRRIARMFRNRPECPEVCGLFLHDVEIGDDRYIRDLHESAILEAFTERSHRPHWRDSRLVALPTPLRNPEGHLAAKVKRQQEDEVQCGAEADYGGTPREYERDRERDRRALSIERRPECHAVYRDDDERRHTPRKRSLTPRRAVVREDSLRRRIGHGDSDTDSDDRPEHGHGQSRSRRVVVRQVSARRGDREYAELHHWDQPDRARERSERSVSRPARAAQAYGGYPMVMAPPSYGSYPAVGDPSSCGALPPSSPRFMPATDPTPFSMQSMQPALPCSGFAGYVGFGGGSCTPPLPHFGARTPPPPGVPGMQPAGIMVQPSSSMPYTGYGARGHSPFGGNSNMYGGARGGSSVQPPGGPPGYGIALAY